MPAKKTQIGIGSMMLLMLVCSIISAGFFYASRIESIQSELQMASGSSNTVSGVTEGRAPQIIFIMFTFTSPLIFAGILATIVSVLRWKNNRRSV